MVIKSDRDRFQNNPKLRPKNAHKDSPQELEPYVAEPELIGGKFGDRIGV
jgi:hypothetical protein